MNIYEKIAIVMNWELPPGVSAEEFYFSVDELSQSLITGLEPIIDFALAGGLEKYAVSVPAKTEEDLYNKLREIFVIGTTHPTINMKKLQTTFPPLTNVAIFCHRQQQNGKVDALCAGTAELIWHSVIATKKLQDRCSEAFRIDDVEMAKVKFNKALVRMTEIWGFTPLDLSALHYFVCQCKSEQFDPSNNKSIYIYGERKMTGKSTLARAFSTAINADTFNNFGKYESTFAKEMGYNAHDLPLACQFNCVTLDEAMPSDSKKTYRSVKSMFTSNSFNFNPKFKSVVNIRAKRNYILTSNDDISEFIQDTLERRFYAIRLEKKPLQVSLEEIERVITDFVVNAQPLTTITTREWYDRFPLLSGVARREMLEAKGEILTMINTFQGFLRDANGYTFSVKRLASLIFKNEPTADQKKAVEGALIDIGMVKTNARYSTMQAINILSNLTDIAEQDTENKIQNLI